MQNWFNTLSEALDAENLLEVWDGSPISYGETVRKQVEILETMRYRTVSIYRNERGMYERPVHYDAGKITC